MKRTVLLKNIPLLIISSGLLLTVAFAQTTRSDQKTVTTDTVPTKQKKIRDLDEALSEIDHGQEEMNRAFKEMDHDKLESEIRNAMKNMEKDMAKMKEDLAQSMKDIDMQKINLEMQKAMKEVDCEQIKQQMADAMSKVDMEKVKADIEKAKQVDVAKLKTELDKIGPEVEKAMREAKVSIEKAKAEITAYKNLVNALDRDGLLKKNDTYKIEYRDKQLTVNGKRLSAEDTKKYSEYLNGKDNFTLEKNEDGLNIQKDK